MNSNDIPKAFDAYYFEHCCGRPYARDEQWFLFFESIADKIMNDIQPESVLDAGCAWGFLVEKLRERRIEAFGIDISPSLYKVAIAFSRLNFLSRSARSLPLPSVS